MSPKLLMTPAEISKGVYLISGGGFRHFSLANVYLVLGKEPTLIDCGQDSDVYQVIFALEYLGVRLTDIAKVVVTHCHYDHIHSIHQLRKLHPGLRLLMHRSGWEIARRASNYETAAYIYDATFKAIEPNWDVDVELDDEDEVLIGNDLYKVISTPGHSEDSICLLGETSGKRILFAGDTYKGSMLSLKGANLLIWLRAEEEWERSLKKLRQLDFDAIYRGHCGVGELLDDPETTWRKFEAYVSGFGVHFPTDVEVLGTVG